jgi:succinate dehydrogenase/fumarate reductase flavoprotein subunit
VQAEDVRVTTDVLIVGTEGAGARAAIEAADAGCDVLCVTKSSIGKSGATLTADADIDVDSRACVEVFGLPGDKRDSEELFFEDMIVEGDYTANQRLVEIHVREAAQRTKEIVDWGARIDRLTHAPGHRYPRGIWIPGVEFRRVLSREVKKRPVKVFQNFMVTDLLTQNGRVVGAVGIDLNTGNFTVIQAKATILCTGGAMRMYEFTTAPDELTGDGLAAAYRVGAEMADMEFPMFLPYILIYPKAVDGVDYTYLLSAYLDSYALNRSGERYMAKWDPVRMERTTRDVNSIAALIEVLEGRGSPHNGTYLSLTHFPKNVLDFAMKEWLPTNVSNYKYGGFDMREFLPDLSENAVETAPACHFWNGGIVIDEWCRTTVEGLWASGEGTGLIQGANRLSGNALTQTQVWGPRAGIDAARAATQNGHGSIDRSQMAELKHKVYQFLGRKGENPIDLRNRIRRLSHLQAGPVRDDAAAIQAAINEVEEMKKEWAELGTRTSEAVYDQEWIEAIQIENLLSCLELVLRTSLVREESRGAAYRRDFPMMNNHDWVKNVVVRRGGDQPDIEVRPVVVTSLTPPTDIRKYGQKHLPGSSGGSEP